MQLRAGTTTGGISGGRGSLPREALGAYSWQGVKNVNKGFKMQAYYGVMGICSNTVMFLR